MSAWISCLDVIHRAQMSATAAWIVAMAPNMINPSIFHILFPSTTSPTNQTRLPSDDCYLPTTAVWPIANSYTWRFC